MMNDSASLARMVDCTSDMLSILDTDFRYLAVNAPYARLFGKTVQHLSGTTIEQAFAHDPGHYQRVVRPLLEACRNGEENIFAQWVEIPGKGRRYFEVHYQPLRDADGRIDALCVISRDRTEIMGSMQALQQSERMLKRTQQIAKLGGWTLDVETGITQWTDEMYEIHEVGHDFVPTTENLAAFITPEETARVLADLEQALAGKETSLISHMTSASGKHKWVRSLAFPVLKDGKVVSLDGMLQDITDIVEMQNAKERALRSLENQKYVLDQHAIVTVTDTNDRLVHVNQLFSNLSGYTSEELLGQSNTLFNAGVHPPEFFQELWRTIRSGQVWRGEICNRARNGSIFWLHTTIVPLLDEHGTIQEYVSVSADITRLKQAEITLRRAQKMEAIGQLSGGIAHDFNNLLGIVIGNIELAELLLPPGHEVGSSLQNARNAAMRGSVLTRRLLNFSRQTPVGGPLLDVNQVLSGLEVLISKSLTAMVKVEMHLDPGIGKVQIPAGDFEDAIINLAINAGDAMPEGGSLYFTTNRLVLAQPEPCGSIELPAGEWVELNVIDTGIGMTADTMEKIFEPYYTTKTGNKGTGLGLSMVYGFVRRSSGHITVSSSPGRGTSFSIYLPVATLAARENEIVAAYTGNPMGAKPGETILLVDDEEEIVKVTASHLQKLGYATLGCTTAEAALAILQGDVSVDLLFTDIVMPGGINGIELAERGLQLRPGLKVLMTTGYARVKDRESMERWNDRVLAKPYGTYELSRRLREMLDQ